MEGLLRFFIVVISAQVIHGTRYSDYNLHCIHVNCNYQHVEQCCSASSQNMGRSLSPLANWRFGSVFRNSIPPARPYKVPTFEEIFETDHSTKQESDQEASQQIVLNLNSNKQTQSDQKNLFKFSNLLSENSRNSLSSNQYAKEMLSKLSKKDLLDEVFFETSTQPYVSTTTQSYQELQKLKLIERAKEELRKKQLRKDQIIKAQQKQEKFIQIIQKQKEMKQELEEKQKQQAKTPRSQDLDNFFAKINGFSDKKQRLENQLKHEVIKKYQDKLSKKSQQEQQYSEKLERWKKEEESKKLSQINGKNYVDMSEGTIILDQSSGVQNKLKQSQELTSDRRVFQTSAAQTVTAPHTDKKDVEDERTVKNEVTAAGGAGDMFDREMCERLRVPCRFVTEHPCCKLPQDIGMMARPRAMDGSADLRWRLYQSRGRGRSKSDGRMLTGFNSGYNSKIPYSSWSSPKDIRVPRYFYDGGPDLTSTILSQCWRLTYLNCIYDREHPCCALTNRKDSLANNVIDRWLTRY